MWNKLPSWEPTCLTDSIQLTEAVDITRGTADQNSLQDEFSHEFSLEDELLLRQDKKASLHGERAEQ